LVKATYWRKENDRVYVVEIRHPSRYKSENGLAQKYSGEKSDRTSLQTAICQNMSTEGSSDTPEIDARRHQIPSNREWLRWRLNEGERETNAYQ
jgi:hypothetical protein